MIQLTDNGKFKLAETRHGNKVLVLNDNTYAWVVAPGIGSLLIYSEQSDADDDVLSDGEFRLYDVNQEAGLASALHLELQVDKDAWQGYLLLAGLPDKYDTRKRMLTADQIITGNPLFSSRLGPPPNRRLESTV